MPTRKPPPAPPPALDLPPTPWTSRQALDVFTAYQDTAAPPPAVVKGWQQALDTYPTLWEFIGDLARHARERMLENCTPLALSRAALRTGADGLACELGRDAAPMLEKLLIDQIVVSWMNLYIVQQGYTNHHTGEWTLSVSEYWEKRLTAAQKRHLRACEMLAKVRKLSAVQPLQVNIGGQQINVAGGVPTSTPAAPLLTEGAPVEYVPGSVYPERVPVPARAD